MASQHEWHHRQLHKHQTPRKALDFKGFPGCFCINPVRVLDPACGSGGMFVSSADFIAQYGANANMTMTFYGQEKVEYNARLCLMNMAVHGLNAKIVSGDAANSFYNDHFALEGKCDFLMANEAVICGLTPEKARNFKEFAA